MPTARGPVRRVQGGAVIARLQLRTDGVGILRDAGFGQRRASTGFGSTPDEPAPGSVHPSVPGRSLTVVSGPPRASGNGTTPRWSPEAIAAVMAGPSARERDGNGWSGARREEVRVLRSRSSPVGGSGRTGARAADGETSKGNEAHGRIGRPRAGNGQGGVTDPTAEKRLGAALERALSSRPRVGAAARPSGEVVEVVSGNGGGPESPSRMAGNGREATAPVTGCGCGRGESFEGYGMRRGEGLGTPSGSWFARDR